MSTALDWRRHRIGPPAPCRYCRRPALCRDQHGKPCHKTCAETNTASVRADDALLPLEGAR